MRTINITIMFGLAAISALLGMISLISGVNHFSTSAAATVSLAGLSTISLAYAMLVCRSPTKRSAAQFLLLALYVTSAISGVLASSNIGLIPYIMESMKLNFTAALYYVWLTLLICGCISIASYILAHVYIQRQNTNTAHTPSASA